MTEKLQLAWQEEAQLECRYVGKTTFKICRCKIHKEILDKRINVNNSFRLIRKIFPLGDSSKKLPLGDYKLNQPMLLPEKNKAFSIRR